MAEIEKTPTFCARCGDISDLKCSRCNRANYCGQVCQRAHWPAHKLRCSVVEKLTNEFITQFLTCASEKISGNIAQLQACGAVTIDVYTQLADFVCVRDIATSYMVRLHIDPQPSTVVRWQFIDSAYDIKFKTSRVHSTCDTTETYVVLTI